MSCRLLVLARTPTPPFTSTPSILSLLCYIFIYPRFAGSLRALFALSSDFETAVKRTRESFVSLCFCGRIGEVFLWLKQHPSLQE